MKTAHTLEKIHQWAHLTPHSNAVVLGDLALSYQLFAEYIVKFAKSLEKLGVKPGMLVGLHANELNKMSELIFVLSLQSLGAVRLSDYSEDEVRCACDLIFVLSPTTLKDDGVRYIYLSREWIETVNSLELAAADYECLIRHSPLPGQAILFGNTSGTTGKKKYFFEHCAAIHSQIDLIKSYYFGEKTKHFISLYGVHVSASYIAACAAFHQGGAIIFSSRDNFVELVRTYPKSHALMLLREANYFANRTSSHLSSDEKLANIRVLGAHLPDRIRTRLMDDFALSVKNSYSSNEAGQIAEILPDGEGLIYPGVELKIVDESGRHLADGLLGRVATKSTQQISGYLWNPQLNEQHFQDGWFISHDIGYITKSGNLVYVDRADHMINLGGIKIPPKPFEDRIKQLAFISDCVLIGENACFDVETLLVGIETSNPRAYEELGAAITSILQDLFITCRIFYRQEFPRTETGKVKRNELHGEFLRESLKASTSVADKI